jgi:hypothetical protein
MGARHTWGRDVRVASPVNWDHTREHKRKSEFCFATKLEIHRGVTATQSNAGAWPRSSSQKAKSQIQLSKSPSDALGIWHPTTDEPATLAPGPHGRGGFDRNGHGVCRIMVAVTMRMSSRRRPISLIRRSIGHQRRSWDFPCSPSSAEGNFSVGATFWTGGVEQGAARSDAEAAWVAARPR